MGPPLRCFLDNRIVAGGPFPRVPKVGLCQWWFNSGPKDFVQDFAFGRVARSLRALPNAKSCTEKAHKEFRGSPKRKILRFCSIARVLLYFPRYFGTWRSLVARLLWEQDVAGSNPVVPTMNLGCEPCRAITFGRARLSLTKKLTENKEQLADLQVTNSYHLVSAEKTKPSASWSEPQVVGQ